MNPYYHAKVMFFCAFIVFARFLLFLRVFLCIVPYSRAKYMSPIQRNGHKRPFFVRICDVLFPYDLCSPFQLRWILYSLDEKRSNQPKVRQILRLLREIPLRRSRKALWAVQTACGSRCIPLRGIPLRRSRKALWAVHTAVPYRGANLTQISLFIHAPASRYALRAPHAITCRFVPPNGGTPYRSRFAALRGAATA